MKGRKTYPCLALDAGLNTVARVSLGDVIPAAHGPAEGALVCGLGAGLMLRGEGYCC